MAGIVNSNTVGRVCDYFRVRMHMGFTNTESGVILKGNMMSGIILGRSAKFFL